MVNTVIKILIICISPTFFEFAPHSSAPNAISNKPPGEEIKKASTFGTFKIL